MSSGNRAIAQPADMDKNATRHAEVTLISRDTAVRPGQPARLGVLFNVSEGWHIYWNGFTTTGIPPSVKWTLPTGAKAGELEFPVPTRHVDPGGILDHIYEGRVLLPVSVDIPPTAKPGDKLTFRARVDYLVCKDVCVGEKAEVSLTLPVAAPDHTAAPDPKAATLFQSFESRLPRPFPTDGSISASWSNNSVTITAPGATGLRFFPSRESVEFADLIKDGEATGEKLIIGTVPDAPKDGEFSGIVSVTRGANKTSDSFVVKLTRNQPVLPAPSPTPAQPATVPMKR